MRLDNLVREIVLIGPIPSKKNLYRRRAGGGLYHDSTITAQLDALCWQAISQRPPGPLTHPNLEIEFYVANDRSDIDGKYTSLCDILQKSKIIKNDCVKYFNGTVTLLPAKLAVREKVIIRIL